MTELLNGVATETTREIRVSNELRLNDAAKLWRELNQLSPQIVQRVVLDLAEVSVVEGGSAALVAEARSQLARRGIKVELVGAKPTIDAVFAIYSSREDATSESPVRSSGLATGIGQRSAELLKELRSFIDFLGDLVSATLTAARKPRSVNFREFFDLCEKTGANALPIVVLINFLVGFVMAFQAAKQLRLYGANLYVADLIGISVVRELAPLMTAIIVCGRSGAAFAAELGSMKVNEELDALRTLGLMPLGWLVLPRVAALFCVVPLLTLVADFVGIAGGLVVAVMDLELTLQGYVNETRLAVLGWDVLTGLLKSVAYSLAIAIIACQQGMSASAGAEGVGRRTTSSVVITLFALVALDAVFTVVFRVMDR